MFKRRIRPIKNRSFFLFGARGTGKTTWLDNEFSSNKDLRIDLLENDLENEYLRAPATLDFQLQELKQRKSLPRYVIIDEVQKVPALLNTAQKWIQKEKQKFVFTGSSSRKLKRGHANLLGGRANSYTLHPLSVFEIGKRFDLHSVLEWGSLPETLNLKTDREKTSYLKSYCNNYLKEEILVEQLVRKLPPFKEFLSLLAQNNGQLLNYEKFSRDIGVDHKTIISYLEILEETYLGIILRAHHPSLRKSQLLQPKFYFFDLGVKRQLDGTLEGTLHSSTNEYGRLFESFLIQEVYRTNEYEELGWRMSFYKSKAGAEIDLILSKGRRKILIEIKSSLNIDLQEVKDFEKYSSMLGEVDRKFYISRDKKSLRIESVECVNFMDFLLKVLPRLF